MDVARASTHTQATVCASPEQFGAVPLFDVDTTVLSLSDLQAAPSNSGHHLLATPNSGGLDQVSVYFGKLYAPAAQHACMPTAHCLHPPEAGPASSDRRAFVVRAEMDV